MKLLRVICLPVLMCCGMSLFAQQQPPVVLWKKVLGGSGEDRAHAIVRTVDNGFLIVGSSMSNNGDVSGHHGPTTTTDAWVLKLNADGGIVWQKSFGGSGSESFASVIAAPDGSYICLGTTNSTDGDVSGIHSTTASDLWMVKIDRHGNLIWQKCYGGTRNETAAAIRNTPDGNAIIMAGTTSGDGDVTGYHLEGGSNPSYRYDIWVLKINTASGAIIWQRALGGTSNEYGTDVQETPDGGFIIAAELTSDDGTFGPDSGPSPRGRIIRMRPDFTMAWKYAENRYLPEILVKVSPTTFLVGGGSFICAPQNPGTSGSVSLLTVDRQGSPPYQVGVGAGLGFGCGYSYTIEGPNSIVPINPADNIVVASTTDPAFAPGVSGQTAAIMGFKTTSGPSWKMALGGTGSDHLSGIVAINDNEYLAIGYTNSNNGDVSGNHGSYDVWAVRLGKTNNIKGTVYLDYNLSGTRDSNEPLAGNILVQSEKGTVKAGSLSYGGHFSNSVDTGTYQTKVLSTPMYYTAVPAVSSSTFTSYNNSDSLSFALQPVPGQRDYRIRLHSPSAHRPGFDVDYRIQLVNVGTDTLINKLVKLHKDARLHFLSSVPVHTSITDDTVYWNIAYLAPRDTVSINIKMNLLPPPAVNIGATIISKASIDNTGDLRPTDNVFTMYADVSGAYDPNDKNEATGDNFNTQDLADGKHLTYTIRFQNTGNDTAFNVVIRDTLDAKLDWSAIEMVSSSHPYKLTVTDGNKLEWKFPDILLVDSVHNEPLSHGYITYVIKPKSTLAVGDVISNSASIYFDFNPPVKTNTHVTVIKPGIPPPSPLVTGMQNNYCHTAGIQKGKISNLPAAGSGVTVKVTFNGNDLMIAADSTFSFDVSAYAPAVYQLRVIFTNSFGADTLMRTVTIEPAVTPEVNVSANTTSIVNLIDPVIVTASNASGGGSSPLYAFAKDRAFTNILQSEGSSNVANIDPNTLQPGDNWIYVRMKTSTTCYTTQFNTDSIKLSMQLPVPPVPVINGLKNTYCTTEGLQKGKLGTYPAPATGAVVTVKLDGSNLALAADSSFSFNVSNLSAGPHVVEVIFANVSGSRSTAVNFIVAAPETPDVSATSSVYAVLNANDQATITAGNTAGGGNAPLYTFAKDRNFTQILQAESATTTYSTTWPSLSLGSNRIYVRMKTSATCYTQQTAIDSVEIMKFGSTGLVDPDYPGQRISFNPNPFRSRLTIHGLSAVKSYTITIYNAQGREVYRTRVVNRTVAALPLPGQPAGVYQLSVYDETKKRLIGTTQIVKQ